jgi:hypothetical protein
MEVIVTGVNLHGSMLYCSNSDLHLFDFVASLSPLRRQACPPMLLRNISSYPTVAGRMEGHSTFGHGACNLHLSLTKARCAGGVLKHSAGEPAGARPERHIDATGAPR